MAKAGQVANKSKKKTISTLVKKSRRQGGAHIAQKGVRGEGLKFAIETYAAVASFTPGTLVKYGPNPKRPDSKSFDRYAGYEKAKTIGEALKLGAKPADLMWEYQRGDYKVLGGTRPEAKEIAAIGEAAYKKAAQVLSSFNGPNGCPVKFNDQKAVEKLQKEEAWRADRLKRVEKRATDMRLKVETNAEIEASTESADIRLQRRTAEAIAYQKLKSGKKITDADLLEVVDHWGFCECSSRLNVMPEGQKYVYSDTIGAIRARSFGFGSTPPTKRYPGVPKLMCQWLKDNKPNIPAKFVCTAINLNCNYAGRRHRDGNNEGPSVIRAVGKFKGGKLLYFHKDDGKTVPRDKLHLLDKKDAVALDIGKKTAVFDGNRAHEVEPFEGERYSIVFFTARSYRTGKPKDIEFLKTQCGFPFPTPADLAKLKKAQGCLKKVACA